MLSRILALALLLGRAAGAELQHRIDPTSRQVEISYDVPANAPDDVEVRAEYMRCDATEWRPAAVLPLIGVGARRMMPRADWDRGMIEGRLRERRAAGLTRTLVWNPVALGSVDACTRFRVTVGDRAEQTEIAIRNSDVILLRDWTKVVQQATGWTIRAGEPLQVPKKGVELPQLTHPLNLRGNFAIFVALPPRLGEIELRLSGDERSQIFSTHRTGEETLWREADMTRQHLVIRQPYRTVYEYEEAYRAHLDYVRLVPVPKSVAREHGTPKIVAGYNEPYSWAFYEKVESTLQHWEPLLAFAEGKVQILDTQFGRAGMKLVYESRAGEQLVGETLGDPVRGAVPRTSNVGRMQQYTNMMATQARFARRLGMRFFANLGATNCYPNSPLQADFCRDHPEWRIGNSLRYDVPEVRRYVLSLFAEALEIGVDGISLDWCRYPNSVRDKESVTAFFRELRALAGPRVPILTRFPAHGVPGSDYMDYATWVREGLVDYLAPSNIQGRHLTFPIAPYLTTVRGSKTKLLPCVDALKWGLPYPDLWLERVLSIYDQGADGVYIYQADQPVLSSPEDRRSVSLAASHDALRQWKRERDRMRDRASKGIFLNPPTREGKEDRYERWERVRIAIEGIEPGPVELLLDGKVINRYERPPYVLTSEERSDDGTIAAGRHELVVRARDGAGWLEQRFSIDFAK